MAIRYLILALTRRCNLRCVYCYNGDGHDQADMPERVIRAAIGLVARGHSFHLQLTGGEPTLVPGAVEAAARLARDTGRCGRLGIQTNATCLTPQLLALFKAYDFQVGVSLDGPPAVHQQQRGMAAETLRGLQVLDAAGIDFRVTTVVTQANVSVLDRLVLTLAGYSHARGIGLDLLVAKGRAADQESGAGVIPADASSLDQGLRRMLAVLADVNRHRQIPIRLREQDLFRQPRKQPVFCHACLGESLAVDPSGAVFPCGQTLGDPYFAAGTVWQPQFDRLGALGMFRPDATACDHCLLKSVCPGDCPSRLHYNRHADRMQVCQLYRTLREHDAQHTSMAR